MFTLQTQRINAPQVIQFSSTSLDEYAEDEEFSVVIDTKKTDQLDFSERLNEIKAKNDEHLKIKLDKEQVETIVNLKNNLLNEDFGEGVTGKDVLTVMLALLEQEENKTKAVETENSKKRFGFIPKFRKKKHHNKRHFSIDEINIAGFNKEQNRNLTRALNTLETASVLSKNHVYDNVSYRHYYGYSFNLSEKIIKQVLIDTETK